MVVAVVDTIIGHPLCSQQRPASAMSSPSRDFSCSSHDSLIVPPLRSVPAKGSPCFLVNLAEMVPVARQVRGAHKPPSTRLRPPTQAGIARLDKHQRRRTTGLPGTAMPAAVGSVAPAQAAKEFISCVRFAWSSTYPLFGGIARHVEIFPSRSGSRDEQRGTGLASPLA